MQKKSKFKKCQPKATYILCNLDPNQTLYHYTKLKQNSRGKKHDLNRLKKKQKNQCNNVIQTLPTKTSRNLTS